MPCKKKKAKGNENYVYLRSLKIVLNALPQDWHSVSWTPESCDELNSTIIPSSGVDILSDLNYSYSLCFKITSGSRSLLSKIVAIKRLVIIPI